MRREEELRGHRYRAPWQGEYRLFRSVNVVKLEDYRPPKEMEIILARLRDRKRETEKATIASILAEHGR